jgi:hypothetical protein
MYITKKYIHINTKYRDKQCEDPYNFLYTLPFFIENVVAIRLNSIEMVPGSGKSVAIDSIESKTKYFFFCLDDYTNNEPDKHIVCLDQNKVLNEKVLGKVQIYDSDNAKIISSDFDCKENVQERLYQNRYNLQRFRVKLFDENGDFLGLDHDNENHLEDFSFTLEVDVIDGI